MTSDYTGDRLRSDKFLPQIIQIVGPYLLEPSTLEADTKEATDLMILRARDLRIGARVRRPGAFEAYGNQFTIRSKRERNKTELAKILEGWGDLLFYAHADEYDHRIAHWMIVDLDVFRGALLNHGGQIVSGEKSNKDGSSDFRWYDVRSFPNKDILLAASPALSSYLNLRADAA
jgi:hypothetical protein